MPKLLAALSALAGGKDRVELATLFRALTTLGTAHGTGAGGGRPELRGGGLSDKGGGPWRGMPPREALELLDAFNLPKQVRAWVPACMHAGSCVGACLYACRFACGCLLVCMQVRVWVPACMHAGSRVGACLYACRFARGYVCVCVCVCICACACA